MFNMEFLSSTALPFQLTLHKSSHIHTTKSQRGHFAPRKKKQKTYRKPEIYIAWKQIARGDEN